MTENPPDIPAWRAIARATRGTVFDGRLFAVGGFIRDRLIGCWDGREIDMVLEGDALTLARFLYERGVARGAPVEYPRFGTALIQVAGLAIELVTARKESYHESSRKPDVEAATVAEDVFRRDFTINALLQNVHTGQFLDPTGRGLADLETGVLRTPLDPDQTFFDDPLRMLRAVRFVAQLGFSVYPEVAVGIRRCCGRLAIISQERIRDELSKLLKSPRPALGIAMMQELGLMEFAVPELVALAADHPESFRHTLRTVGAAPPIVRSRLVALLHHAATPDMAGARLELLRFSRVESEDARLMLSLREAIIGRDPATWTDGEVRKFVRKACSLLEALLAFVKMDRSEGDPALEEIDVDAFAERIDRLEERVVSAILASPLDGKELMHILQAKPGPLIRDAKEWLLNEVLEGRLAADDKALASHKVTSWNASRTANLAGISFFCESLQEISD